MTHVDNNIMSAFGGGWFTVEGLEASIYVSNLAMILRAEITNQIVPVFKSAESRISKDAPFRTEELRRLVRFGMGKGKGILSRIRISAGHAGFVNFGTIRMSPRPFATNGYNYIVSQLKALKNDILLHTILP